MESITAAKARKIKPEIYTFFILLAVQLAVFAVLCIGFGKGFSGIDCGVEYVSFFSELRHKLLEGRSVFYSWNGAGGYDFWTAFAYYLSSPLNIFVVFFKEEYIVYFVNILIILKTSLCGASFAYYLRVKYSDNGGYSPAPFGVIYGMSGFMIAYGLDLMWMDSIFLFPFILLQTEKLVYEKKASRFIALVAMALIFNFYSGLIVCIGIFFYFFTLRFNGLKDFIIKLIRTAGASVVSVGIAGVFLLPSAMAFKELGGFTATGNAGLLGSFADTLKGFLFSESPFSISYEAGRANLYITVFALVLFAVFLSAGCFSKNEKLRYGIIAIFLILSMNIGVLNYIWHGFRFQVGIPNRFSYMLNFLVLVAAWRVYCKRNEIEKKRIIFASAGCAAVLAVIAIAGKCAVLTVVLNPLLAAMYCVLFTAKKHRKAVDGILHIAPIIGTIVMLVISLSNLTGNDIKAQTEGVDEIVNLSQATDDGFSRSRFSQSGSADEEIQFNKYNQGLITDNKGLSLFSSFLNNNYSLLQKKLGSESGVNYVCYDCGNPLTDMLFNVKYIFDKSKNTDNGSSVRVTENEYALSLGYIVPEAFVDEQLNLGYGNVFMNLNSLALAAGQGGIFEPVSFILSDRTGCKNMRYNDGVLTVEATEENACASIKGTLRNAGEVYVYFDRISEVSADVYVNSALLLKNLRSAETVSLGKLNAGDLIEIRCSSPYSDEYQSFGVYCAVLNEASLKKMYNSLSQRQLELLYYDDNTVKGRINASDNGGCLFLSVPAGNGWRVKVDGIETETKLFMRSFIYLELDSGEHIIELEYTTPGFIAGAVISAISLIIFAIECIFEKKRSFVPSAG